LVDCVDAGGVPATPGQYARVADLPIVPPDSLAHEGDLVGRIIEEGKVNADALSALEPKGSAEPGTADFIAGKLDFDRQYQAGSAVFRARSRLPARQLDNPYYFYLLRCRPVGQLDRSRPARHHPLRLRPTRIPIGPGAYQTNMAIRLYREGRISPVLLA